jgi:hypothetical protein
MKAKRTRTRMTMKLTTAASGPSGVAAVVAV